MRTFIVTTLLIISTLILWATAHADCVCLCVNGQPQAMCSNPYETRPMCSGFCPAEPTLPGQVTPVQMRPDMPPGDGTKSCHKELALNPMDAQLQWQWVCE